jgi:hypothetical protein
METRLKYELTRTIDDDTYEALDRLQRRSMVTVGAATAVDHVYTSTELGELANNPRVTKVIVRADGELVGFGAVTDDIDALVQFNGDFFRSRFPDQAKRGTIWYAVAGIVDPEYWRSGLLTVMGEHLADLLYQNGAEVLLWDAVDVRFDMMYSWVEKVIMSRFGAGSTHEQLDSHRWIASLLPPIPTEAVIDLRNASD